MARYIWIGLTVVVTLVASLAGYQLLATRLAADIYRSRLESLNEDYTALRQHYNNAVRRTAVTELLVEDGTMEILVRTSEGVQQRVETSLNPYGEVYIDYVVVGGRLLIRRVFDADTRPSEAFLVDPLLDVDWDDPQVSVGKAVYRALTDGRWIVSVTGDGSLGLALASEDLPSDLPPMPDVREYETISEETRRMAEAISIGDVWEWVVGAPR
ncbi:MAG: hypothetical protein ACYTF7_00830 [Planctomycetota bacterium]|jgi:hypothetical protein